MWTLRHGWFMHDQAATIRSMVRCNNHKHKGLPGTSTQVSTYFRFAALRRMSPPWHPAPKKGRAQGTALGTTEPSPTVTVSRHGLTPCVGLFLPWSDRADLKSFTPRPKQSDYPSWTLQKEGRKHAHRHNEVQPPTGDDESGCPEILKWELPEDSSPSFRKPVLHGTVLGPRWW